MAPYFPPKQKDQFGNEIPWGDDPQTIQWLLNYAQNAMQAEKNHKLWEKEQKAQQEEMKRREQKRLEEAKRRAEQPAVPRGQVQAQRLAYEKERYKCGHCHMRMTYFAYCNNQFCQARGSVNIETGIAYLAHENTRLKQEMRTAVSLDQKTFDRLNEFTKDGESYVSSINRLLDIATRTQEAKI